jgi:hypothetical protein
MFRKMFPKCSVNLQNGVDLRHYDAKVLYNTGLIGQSGYNAIVNGRKWHHELSSKGAVGLAQANRLALQKGTNALLLLEEDFYIHSNLRFAEELALLYDHMYDFDMAVFGIPNVDGSILEYVKYLGEGWYYLSGDVVPPVKMAMAD